MPRVLLGIAVAVIAVIAAGCGPVTPTDTLWTISCDDVACTNASAYLHADATAGHVESLECRWTCVNFAGKPRADVSAAFQRASQGMRCWELVPGSPSVSASTACSR